MDFSALNQVEVPFIAELGTLTASARELLGLKVGGVLALTRATGENINIYIGNVLLGTGEVLVSQGVLAVRVADLKDPNVAIEAEEEQG